MLPVARHEAIVEAVSVGQAVSTDELVRRLGVSAETVRRDLALLEEREHQRKAPARKAFLTRVMVKLANRVVLLKVDEIDFIEADGNYAKLHVGRKAHLLREKMHDLEAQLDPKRFVRIHRSIIVNLDRIKELHPHFNGDYVVLLEDGRQLRLSRSRRENLEARLKAAS